MPIKSADWSYTTNNDGGTVNVRTGVRLKGDTDALVCVSGTANISPNADAINGTSGAGTINATAT